MRKTVIAAAAAIAVASGAMIGQAAAADLDFMPAPAPPPFVPTWAGFYIGGHVGYGEADFDSRMDVDVFDPAGGFVDGGTFSNSFSPSGLIGGVQGGYNWQTGSMVFGLEGDISFTDWSQRSTVFHTDAGDFGGPINISPGDDFGFATTSVDVDFLASIRGRVGFAMDSVLIYGTGGVAWADAQARARVVGVLDDDTVIDATRSRSFNDVGFVLGGGMGWMVIPQTFSVGVEGLYYFFDKKKTLFDNTFDVQGFEVDVVSTARLDDAWVIRARADFHF
jgi:outer membrane immunogenic protein